jgi:hypothetical protein
VKFRGPALTYCKTQNFDFRNKLETWPKSSTLPTLRNFIVQNNARGCTIAFNKAMLNLNNSQSPTKAIMHDWWLALLAYSCGEIVFSPTAEVRYRLHQNNAIGVNKISLFRRISTIRRKSRWEPELQVEELLELFGNTMHSKARSEIIDFTSSIRGDIRTRLTKLTFSKQRFRTSIADELLIRAGFLIFPFLERTSHRHKIT